MPVCYSGTKPEEHAERSTLRHEVILTVKLRLGSPITLERMTAFGGCHKPLGWIGQEVIDVGGESPLHHVDFVGSRVWFVSGMQNLPRFELNVGWDPNLLRHGTLEQATLVNHLFKQQGEFLETSDGERNVSG